MLAALASLAVLVAVMPQDTSSVVHAVRATTGVVVDGRLDDAVWRIAPAAPALVQSDPHEGGRPSERTEVRFAFDDAALYVAARLHEHHPDSVRALLTRRDDEGLSDVLLIYLDPLRDRLTGYSFGVTAAGVQTDGILFADNSSDDSWDGVWTSRVRRDEQGWSVEMRIPFSQLRMQARDIPSWGVNIRRYIARYGEGDQLVSRARDAHGFVSRFAELTGLDGVHPRRRAELLPYVTTRTSRLAPIAGDPFRDHGQTAIGLGADLRVGLGRNLQFDGTINPDFGQVEVDPAVVNLTDIETFYDEKRPFFVEGNNVFRFNTESFGWLGWSNVLPYYSRRIGRAPQGTAPDSPYVETPPGVHILGAGKITGRVGAWTVGGMTAVTRREEARLSDGTRETCAEVEPAASYGVARAQRDFAGGRHGIGVMGTFVGRAFDDPRLRDDMNSSALLGGIDGWYALDRAGSWRVRGGAALSRVTGTPERMIALQRGSVHYFQRPDADHVAVDSSATALSGGFARINLEKLNGSMLVYSSFGLITPGFESNDLGYNSRTDVINGHVLGRYRWTRPSSWYQNVSAQLAVYGTWNLEGVRTGTGLWHRHQIVWRNFSTSHVEVMVTPTVMNTRATRGGPRMQQPADVNVLADWSSDSRQPLQVALTAIVDKSAAAEAPGVTASVAMTYRPSASLLVSLGPTFAVDRNPAQYLQSSADTLATATYGRRYLFGDLVQKTLSADIRVNWIFSPHMSLEVFAQPLVSSGRYGAVRELLRPGSYDFRTFGDAGSTLDRETGVADPDGMGPAPAIRIGHPDFTFASLRGNAVFRWEYSAGSTLYLAWTQTRTRDEESGRFAPGRALGRLLRNAGDNVAMLKISYWLSR